MKKLILILCIALSFISCTKENLNTNEFETPVITGHNFIDNYGSSYGKIGNPNINRGKNWNDPNTIAMASYPIPCGYAIVVELRLPSSNTEKPTIWIKKARWFSEDINTNFQNRTYLDIQSSLIINSGTIPNSNYSLSIKTDKFENGYYIVYAKIGNEILYDNFKVQHL
ncbi:MAG: hypothetical protein ACOYMA_08690 [Bacteroidia bacterium]